MKSFMCVKIILFVMSIFVSERILAEVKLPAIFTDNMVIQRDKMVPVWGWAAPEEKIKIDASWGERADAVSDHTGKWMVKIKTPKAGGPHHITIEGKNKIVLNNVMSGDVWLCAGQSNMEMSMNLWHRNKELATEYLATANCPNIRLFRVPQITSMTPLNDTKGKWRVCNSKNVSTFSAVGFFFGKALYDRLKIPVGLIQCTWGGSSIEAWTAIDEQIHDPVVAKLKEKYDKIAMNYNLAKEKAEYAADKKKYDDWKKNGKKGKAPRRPLFRKHPSVDQSYPGNLYNGMLHPLLPFAIKGTIWYQGESNHQRADHYFVQLIRLIQSWRTIWGEGEFPFYFVQLPNCHSTWKSPVEDGSWPRLREAFLKSTHKVPDTGMAVTIDLGDKDIHPLNKRDVGGRLGRLALNKTYGKKDIVWTGPLAKNCRFEGGNAIIKFETGGSPLAIRGKTLFGFALVDSNGITKRANASITADDTVTVKAPGVKNAVMVYYAWANNPEGCNLYNKEGLPASPFRFGKMPEINLLPESVKKN